MLRKIFLITMLIFSGLTLSGCSLKKTPAAIQITTSPVSDVFIDGNSVGKTPYYGNNYKEGEITLKLIPESSAESLLPWETKIKLNSGVLTLVDRNFSTSETAASGQILSLEKLKDSKQTSLSIISDPDVSLVKFDGELKGFAPISIDGVGLGDHEVIISKDEFAEKKVKVKIVAGYRLIINVKLSGIANATEGVETQVEPQVTPTPKPTGPLGTPGVQAETYVIISETPTGWLRVRQEPNTTSVEVAKINPKEKFLLLEEKLGWYKIEYKTGSQGWISSSYAVKE